MTYSVSTSTIKWLGTLTSVFFRNTPIATVIVVIMTLFSQLAMTMAFLMPLKVVMLLGSDGIPNFFPPVLAHIDKNSLIISLVLLSLTAYIASAVFKSISDNVTEYGVQKLLNQTQKIIIFENQDNIASQAYKKYTTALAGLIFFLVTEFLFYVFYHEIAILIAIFLIAAYLIVYILYNSSTTIENVINDNSHAISIAVISNIGFLILFLYIVLDFLYFSPPDFLIALATIILSRLMLTRLSFTASFFFSLKQEENKINALFFHHHAFIPKDTSMHKTAWELLSDSTLLKWITSVLEEFIGTKVNEADLAIQWKQTRLQNVVILKAELSSTAQSFLIKIFEKRASAQAQHESILIIDNNDELPCPSLLLSTKLEDYHCHIFDITGFEFLPYKDSLKRNDETNEQLLRLPPPDELTERYKRSKAFLWERITADIIDRLLLVASGQDKCIIQTFNDTLPEITAILRNLPLSFINHKQNPTSLLLNSQNQLVSFHWPLWVIEPSGFGMTLDEDKSKASMANLIQVASEYRPELKRFPVECYELTSLLSEFERLYHLQQYEDTINVSQHILDTFYRIKLLARP